MSYVWLLATLSRQVLLARSQRQLRPMESQGLANVVWALGRLGISPGPDWMSALLAQSSSKLADMNAQV